MAATKQISVARLQEVLRKNGGIYSFTAKELGVSWQNIDQRVKASPTLQAALASIERETLDLAKGAMVNLLASEDGPTVRWYLERKGKAEGFGNQTQVDLSFTPEAAAAIVSAVVSAVGGDIDKLRAARSVIAGEPQA